MILYTLFMCLFLKYTLSESDFSQDALLLIFGYIPRLTVGSLVAHYFSQRFDSYLYNKLKNKYNKVYISNNISTIFSQLIDTVTFTFVSFFNNITYQELINIMITMLLFKWIIALLDTQFMVLVTKINCNRELN